jgi:hypothetical protein
MNSHFTQVAQLQFEYIWTRQNRLRWTRYGSRWSQDDFWWMGMNIGFTKVEGNIDWKEIELIHIGNTQILILEFE